MSAPLKKTALHDFIVSQKAKMVPYAGFSMPVSFKGLTNEHKHCRASAVLFDVSHMRQISFRGKDVIAFFESVTPADVVALPAGKGRLSFLPNERCGIIDDCIVHRRSDTELGLVVNAGCADKDTAHLEALVAERKKSRGWDVEMTIHGERSLIALQGPKAAEALGKFVDGLERIDFMCQRFAAAPKLTGTSEKIYITRCGYTGEDGFELSIRHEDINAATANILASLGPVVEGEGGATASGVMLGGLGCRDTLRLEAGMCLYGHELSEDINPLEAGLMWEVTKRRRTNLDTIPFVGSEAFKELIKPGAVPARKRIGLTSKGGPCPREGSEIKDAATGEVVGVVTSGSPSPTIGGGINVHQGYVKSEYAKEGSGKKLVFQVRNRQVDATVTKTTCFINTNYYRMPANLQ
jgi:aminomethyltransferase